jgi:hypothetical protein
MKLTHYNGVTHSVRCESRPWRAQCAAAGRNYHLGNFETEEEAARAYDNLVYYLRDFGFSHPGTLNFPDDYDANPLPMSEKTGKIVLECTRQHGAHDPQELQRAAARCISAFRQMAAAISDLEQAVSTRAAVSTIHPVTPDAQL